MDVGSNLVSEPGGQPCKRCHHCDGDHSQRDDASGERWKRAQKRGQPQQWIDPRQLPTNVLPGLGPGAIQHLTHHTDCLQHRNDHRLALADRE